jgi:hypothetical protein
MASRSLEALRLRGNLVPLLSATLHSGMSFRMSDYGRLSAVLTAPVNHYRDWTMTVRYPSCRDARRERGDRVAMHHPAAMRDLPADAGLHQASQGQAAAGDHPAWPRSLLMVVRHAIRSTPPAGQGRGSDRFIQTWSRQSRDVVQGREAEPWRHCGEAHLHPPGKLSAFGSANRAATVH